MTLPPKNIGPSERHCYEIVKLFLRGIRRVGACPHRKHGSL